MPATRVVYVGEGAYIIGVPATDLTCPTRKEADRLVATGLYVIDDEQPDHVATSDVEEGDPA